MGNASDLFIEALEEEGVEYIFGIPGEENLAFLESLSKSKKIKLILTRHEQGAFYGSHIWTINGENRSLHRYPRTRCHQLFHGSRLCPTGWDANDDDYRPKAH